MTRTLVCLAAAMGLLMFAGCGEVPGGGVALATNSAPPKPAPPAPGDQDQKPTPPPLIPAALPKVAPDSELPAGGQPPFGQPTDTGSSGAAPANVGAEAVQALFGGGSAQSAPGPVQPGAEVGANPAGDPGQMTVSDLSVTWVNVSLFHFEVSYAFTKGQPNPSLQYVVILRQRKDGDTSGDAWLTHVMPFDGKNLGQSGRLTGQIQSGGTSPVFKGAVVAAWAPVAADGRPALRWTSVVSNETDAATVGGVGHQQGAASRTAPPANGVAEFAQSIFGGGAPAANTPIPIAPGDSAANGPIQMTLSEAKISRDAGKVVHFEVSYEFTQGQPTASNWYALTILQKPVSKNGPGGFKLFEGKALSQRGKFVGAISIPGSNPEFQIIVREGARANGEGRLISNVLDVRDSGDVAHEPPAPVTPAPNPHRKQTSDAAVEIKLSEATVSRINKDAARVEVAYAFSQGRPNFSKLYTLVVHDKADAAAPTNDSQTILEGRSLSLNGKFKCLANLRPATAAVEIVVWEGTAAEPRGRKISNVVEVSIRPDLGQEGTGDLRPAGVGVGAQGKGYGAGIITTPIGALFTAKEQIAFDQIQHDLKIFNAQNNRNPSSQEEFMEKIIKDGGIKLPELPAGEIYVYDPQSGELKVGHEKK